MASIFFLLLAACMCCIYTDAAECENGWSIFKDELCVKTFGNFLTYVEAQQFCASQGNSVSDARLVMVKDSQMQEFLDNITQTANDHLWLGAKYDNRSEQFLWEDGEPIAYSNWNEGHPRNASESEMCIQFKPRNTRDLINNIGKWEDVTCQKRNLAICQRTAPWSLEEATREIINLRKELKTSNNDLVETKQALGLTQQELETTKDSLNAVNARVVPVGSIYIEYFDQPSPVELWPTLTWQDVTSSYAGMFFRALGGNSESWGVHQMECASRLSEMEYTEEPNRPGSSRLTIPQIGWSDYGHIGRFYEPGNTGAWERIRLLTESCENRPNNQAIRIWKRQA